MQLQAQGLSETLLGKDHPDALTKMNNLVGLLSYQGKYEQAEEMQRQVLGLRETVSGKEHHDIDEHGKPDGGAKGSGQVRTAFEDWAKVKYIGGIFH